MKDENVRGTPGDIGGEAAALQMFLQSNVKAIGYQIARQLAEKLPLVPIQSMPPRVDLKSKACTQDDVESLWFAYWCSQMKAAPVYHRKLWEFCYILQALYDAGVLREGAHGVGFGCGEEPLPSLFAGMGVAITATDAPLDTAGAWVTSGQYAQSREPLFKSFLCEREAFDRLVSYVPADMRKIPANFAGQFDFTWSACALEHLGSIEAGLTFIEKSLECVKPGGVAVHTTEWNFASEDRTLEDPACVLFLRKHFEDLAARLTGQGCIVAPFDFEVGSGFLDKFIDVPPYEHPQHAHLRLMLGKFSSTSFGIIVSKL